jgi:hypothetical protein
VNVELTHATIAKLELGPEDAVVIKATEEHRRITADMATELIRQTQQILGEGTRVIVLPYGLEIDVIEKTAA